MNEIAAAEAASHGPNAETGRLDVGLAAGGSLRWAATDITPALEEARRRLDLSPVAAVALGRALSAATLIRRIFLKVPSRILLEVKGNGPLGTVIAEASADGALRGTVGEPHVEAPEDGSMSIAGAIGTGTLRVTREDGRSRYSGEVELVSSELGDDIAHYLQQSEQIRSAVLLGVLPRPTGIAAAGGLIVEALPGTDDEVIERLEDNVRSIEGVSYLLDSRGVPGLERAVLGGLDQEILERERVEYRCRCDRQSLLEKLRPLAATDLDALLDEDGRCEATCAFCSARYLYAADELTATN